MPVSDKSLWFIAILLAVRMGADTRDIDDLKEYLMYGTGAPEAIARNIIYK